MKLLRSLVGVLRASNSSTAPCVFATRARTTRVADDARAAKPGVVLDEQRVRPLRPSAVLRVRLPCSVEISATGVGDDSDEATASLLGARPQLFLGGESPIAFSPDAEGGAGLSMTEGAPQPTAPRTDLLCRLRVPFMTSLDVELSSGAHATLENVVLDRCSVHTTGSADIVLSNVKANEMTLSTVDGTVKATGVMQGNLEVTVAGSGGFEVQRLLANRLKVETSAGSQHVSAAYAEEVELISGEGSVNLGTLHSHQAKLTTRTGTISVGGLDGDKCTVTTTTGDVSVMVTRSRHLEVTTGSGNVTLVLSSPCKVTTAAPVVESNFDSLPSEGCSGDEATISARSGSGRIIVKKQDWVSSLNLGGPSGA